MPDKRGHTWQTVTWRCMDCQWVTSDKTPRPAMPICSGAPDEAPCCPPGQHDFLTHSNPSGFALSTYLKCSKCGAIRGPQRSLGEGGRHGG